VESRGCAADRRKYGRNRNRVAEKIMQPFTFDIQPLGQEFTVIAKSWKDAFDQIWAQLDEKQREAVRSLEVQAPGPPT
jgi:hypothetical protein